MNAPRHGKCWCDKRHPHKLCFPISPHNNAFQVFNLKPCFYCKDYKKDDNWGPLSFEMHTSSCISIMQAWLPFRLGYTQEATANLSLCPPLSLLYSQNFLNHWTKHQELQQAVRESLLTLHITFSYLFLCVKWS